MPELSWRGERLPPLVLGTAQLGLNYGVANCSGRPNAATARELVAAARAGGVDLFDTAQAYGEAEAALGAALRDTSGSPPRVVSKLAPTLDPTDGAALRAALAESRRRVGGALWGLLLHRPEWLAQWDRGLGAALLAARDAGEVRWLGASVYAPDQARQALARPELDLLQLPANAWDGRWEEAGILAECRARNVLAFIRSIYLQGLLVLSAAEAGARVPAAAAAARRWNELAGTGEAAARLAFRYARGLGAPLVVGMETAAPARTNLEWLNLPPLTAEERADLRWEMRPFVCAEVVDPSRWPAIGERKP